MEVGQEIRRLREAKGLSQAKLAAAADMAVSGVSQIETGARNPSAVTLTKLANALDVEVADFFPKGQAPLPLEEPPEYVRWARAAAKPELEAFAADATTAELEALRSALGEERAAWRAAHGSPHPPVKGGEQPQRMPAAAEETYWDLVEREGVVVDELRRRYPPPAATITYFAPEHRRRPLVRWLVPQEERDSWRAELEMKFPKGFDEVEAEEARSTEAVAVETLA